MAAAAEPPSLDYTALPTQEGGEEAAAAAASSGRPPRPTAPPTAAAAAAATGGLPHHATRATQLQVLVGVRMCMHGLG